MTWIIMLPLLAVAFSCASIPTLYDSGTGHARHADRSNH